MKWTLPIARWIYRWRYRKISCVIVQDLPGKPAPGVCYVAIDHNAPWATAMQCPCGCGESITLNLVGSHAMWSLHMPALSTASLFPSIWRTNGCKSHFWLRCGRIVWAQPNCGRFLYQKIRGKK